jgi:hypothetical protein
MRSLRGGKIVKDDAPRSPRRFRGEGAMPLVPTTTQSVIQGSRRCACDGSPRARLAAHRP